MTTTAAKTTAAQIAEIAEHATWMKGEAAKCRAEVAVQVLVGQGYICVLAAGGMAIGSEGDQWRLKLMSSHRCGISHWTRDDAEKAAAHWNEGTEAALHVKVIHYRDALIAQAESLERSAAFWERRVAEMTAELEA